jgi:hypothetical protein
MQSVCDVLEELLACGVIQKYAMGGAMAAGFHGEPLATRDIDVFCYLDAPTDSLLSRSRVGLCTASSILPTPKGISGETRRFFFFQPKLRNLGLKLVDNPKYWVIILK